MSFFAKFNHKFIMLIFSAILISGCEGIKKKVPDANSQFGQEINQRFAEGQGKEETAPNEPLSPGEGQDIKEEDIKVVDEGAEKAFSDEPGEVFTLKDIHFKFDKSDLDSDSRAYLETMFSWLDQNRSIKVNIEGHADDRGTSEYNLALGARRADAVKRYLEILGVDSIRLSTISYGEEMPIEEGQHEKAWAANRRVHFEGI
ncbi:MAG: peptidoglycan-associated lipoprotein Pal [Deltaproteobacteria bacterium]|nr:peptidoglycan-associated lipoprotein Pal [Deltaproteobacteria bacterium]